MLMTKTRLLHVRALSARATCGYLVVGHISFPCRLGRTGLSHRKSEGDGATPIGAFRLKRLYYRPGSVNLSKKLFAARPLRSDDGWCDDTTSFSYNRWVRLPFAPSHEKLTRPDHLYDVVITTDHNQCPRVRGAGSAIFFHLTGDKPFTQGCVAVGAADMRKILSLCAARTSLVIWAPGAAMPPARRRSPTPP